MTDTKFTLVIPTYNEASIIRETVQTVVDVFSLNIKTPWSIIVSDNASTDSTASIVEAMKDGRVKVIRLNEKGRGRAIRAGFRAAGGGVVAFTDADLSIQPADIVRGLNMILNGECEIVFGTRFAPGGDTSERSFLRNGSSMIFHLLAKTITGLRASDSQCPLKIMNERTTPIMLATEDPTWWSELEFLLLTEKLKIKTREISVIWHEGRYAGRKSTVKVVKDGFKAIKAMFKMRFRLSEQLKLLKDTLKV